MPAARSSPIDPAIGQLLAAARALGRDGAGILPLLAAFPDTRARRAGPRPRRGPARQVDVHAKTNEIPLSATLLDGIDLAGAVVTAGAMHAQRGHAEYLAGQRRADYLITAKRNQPGLHAQLAGLPWRQIPAADIPRDRGAAVPSGDR